MAEKYHYLVNVEAAIFNEDGKWLVVERSQTEPHAAGMMAWVGGKVEDTGRISNILETSLKREVLEEVGIEIEVLQYIESASFTTDDKREAVNVVFLCKHKSGEAKPNDPDEVAQVYWITAKEIEENKNTPPWMQQSLKKAVKLMNGE